MKGLKARLALGALALVFLAASCSSKEDGNAQTLQTSAERAAERRVPVRTATIEASEFRDALELTALLEPWKEVVLATEFGGFVREVNFEKGQLVDRGAVIARIGDDLAAARLDQAKAELLAAEANYTKVSKLFERQAVPQQDLVAATSRRDNAAALVREMEISLDRAIVRAPVTGVAVDRAVEPGEVLAPGQRLTTLHRVDRLKAAVQVPDTEIGWLQRGRAASLRLDAYPGRSFEASLRYVAPAADTDTRTFLVEFALDDGRAQLRPGMVGTLSVVRRLVEDAVVVPTDALVVRQEGFVAFVVRECRAELRDVVVGGSEGERVLIESGLAAGEELVISGQRDLIQGQAVRSEACR